MHLVTAIQVNGNPDKTYRMFPLALWTYGIPLKRDRVSKLKFSQHCRACLRRNLQFPPHHTEILSTRSAQDRHQVLVGPQDARQRQRRVEQKQAHIRARGASVEAAAALARSVRHDDGRQPAGHVPGAIRQSRLAEPDDHHPRRAAAPAATGEGLVERAGRHIGGSGHGSRHRENGAR